MKSFIQNAIMILTICAMVSFVGCGDKKDKTKDKKDSTKTEAKK